MSERGVPSQREESPLGALDTAPPLLAFGFDRQSEYVGLGGWIGAAADDQQNHLTIRLRSVDGKSRTLRLRCGGMHDRSAEFDGTHGSAVLPIPPHGVRECQFGFSSASFTFAEGQARNVVGELLLARGGK